MIRDKRTKERVNETEYLSRELSELIKLYILAYFNNKPNPKKPQLQMTNRKMEGCGRHLHCGASPN